MEHATNRHDPRPGDPRPGDKTGQVGVVLNPMAGRNRGKDAAGDRLDRIVGDQGRVARCADLDSLQRAAENFHERDVEVVAVSGGDGTSSLVLTALRRVYGDAPLPRLALLRGGTMNTVANGTGAPRGTPAGLLRDLVDRLRRGERLACREHATMDVGGRLAFLFGAGILHGFLAEYYRRGDGQPTPATAATTLAGLVGSALVRGRTIRRVSERLDATITLDGEPMPRASYLGLGAGTTPEVGLGFKPFASCTRDLERFHFLGITGSPTALIRDLPRIYRGVGVSPGTGYDRTPREVIIEPEGVDLVPYMVDGDLAETGPPLVVRTGPRVRIVVG